MMLISGIVLLLAVFSPCLADDKKWVWDGDDRAATRSASQRAAGDFLAKRPLAKYEISEFVEGVNSNQQVRPSDFRPPLDYQDRPYNRPNQYRPQYPGGGGPGPGGFGPSGPVGGLYHQHGGGPGGYGHGGGGGVGPGILTGPVPSWQQRPAIQNFDRCKCTEKFNCNSPGISYGHCDVGKQYCCYNSNGHVSGSPPPSRPVHSIENGILAGPGGPVDHLPPHGGGGGFRPPPGGYNRPPYHNQYRPDGGYGQGGGGVLVGPGGPIGPGVGGRPPHGAGLLGGVLVGPGGPSGIGGRPPIGPHGPFGPTGNYHSPSNGVLVGPGGPYDRPYGGGGYGGHGPQAFGLGRSAKSAHDDKDAKDKSV